MSKLTKSESSRLNGAKSRGPVTPEGRAKSSLNAASHGLTAKTLILRNENEAHFLEIMNAYFDYLQPSNQIEVDLISEMVAARWRLRRVWRYETALLDIEMDAQASDFEKRFQTYDEDMRGGLAFATLVDKSRGLANTIRFDIHLSRTYRKSLDEFRLMRKFSPVEHALACSSDLLPHIGENCENEPTEPPKTALNGENQLLTSAPPEDSCPI
jgi:hypothetical protein